MTIFTSQLWKHAEPLFKAILHHPFNQELMKGSLALDKFAYYLEQDSFYLQEFARAHALVASRAPVQFLGTFLKFAGDSLIAEHELVHQYYQSLYQFQKTGRRSLATVAYTSYLLATCHHASIETAMASLLPCFWIYREVGLTIAKQSSMNNPFKRWIETYSDDKFSESVDEMISIIETMAQNTSDHVRSDMKTAFYNSTALEWHFWDAAYRLDALDNLG